MKISSTLIKAGGNFARPTKFSLLLSVPSRLRKIHGETFDVMCKATGIPEITNESYEIKIKGHPIRIPGRSIQTQEISITFYLDEDYKLRKLFQDWIYSLDKLSPVDNQFIANSYTDMFGEMELIGRDYNESTKKPIKWKFENVFPVNTGTIDFDTTGKDTVSEFTITFAYSRFLTTSQNDRNFIENLFS